MKKYAFLLILSLFFMLSLISCGNNFYNTKYYYFEKENNRIIKIENGLEQELTDEDKNEFGKLAEQGKPIVVYIDYNETIFYPYLAKSNQKHYYYINYTIDMYGGKYYALNIEYDFSSTYNVSMKTYYNTFKG